MLKYLNFLINKNILLLLILLSILFSACVSMPQRPSELTRGNYAYMIEYSSWLIEQKMKKHNITGLSIAFVDDQKVVWSKGFGYADKENDTPAIDETGYRVASISKIFTGLAIMQLAEQKKISLDDPVKKYIPEFSIKSRYDVKGPITIRSIMTHHSGIPSDRAKGLFAKKPKSFRTTVNILKNQYVSYPLKYMYNYSNLAVNLLGIIIERVSGMKFSDYIEKNLFTPMNMTDSSFKCNGTKVKNLSRAYFNNKVMKDFQTRDLPAMNMCSSVIDIAKLIKMINNDGMSGKNRIIKKETLLEMISHQNKGMKLDLNNHSGLIWSINRPGLEYAGKALNHRGLSLFHKTMILILSDHKLGMIVCANSETSTEAITELCDSIIKLALETKTGIKAVARKKPKEIKIPIEDMKKMIGNFATMKGFAKIYLKKTELWLDFLGHTFKMVPNEDRFFSLKFLLPGGIPIRIKSLENFRLGVRWASGKKVLVLDDDGSQKAVGEEFKKIKIPKVWKKRAGTYWVVNPDKDFQLLSTTPQIEYKDGMLFFNATGKHWGIGRLRLLLNPISETEAVAIGLGRSARETIFVKKINGREVIEFSGYMFSKDITLRTYMKIDPEKQEAIDAASSSNRKTRMPLRNKSIN